MNCLMFGLACSQQQFEEYISKTGNPYSVAHYLFETEFIKEFQKHFHINHTYILQIPNYSIKKSLIKSYSDKVTSETDTLQLGYINFPGIKFLTLFISTCLRIKKYKKTKKNFFILSTINYFPVALATWLMSRIYKIKNIVIFTDCSVGYAYDKSDLHIFSKIIRQIYKKIISFLENHYDSYILFSEQMNEIVNKQQKHFCVMEGFFNPYGLDLSIEEKFEKKILLYAGSLIENFGIEKIIKAFNKINDPEYELWIAGDGPYRQELQKLSTNNSNIKFLGYVEHKELFRIEKKAFIVINARDPKLPYTKYSFPSKTFEYLASGTPFISTHLLCYPPEYEEHIFFIDSNSSDQIVRKIQEIQEFDADTLQSIGLNNRKFILDEKNSYIQVNKIVQFLNSL